MFRLENPSVQTCSSFTASRLLWLQFQQKLAMNLDESCIRHRMPSPWPEIRYSFPSADSTSPYRSLSKRRRQAEWWADTRAGTVQRPRKEIDPFDLPSFLDSRSIFSFNWTVIKFKACGIKSKYVAILIDVCIILISYSDLLWFCVVQIMLSELQSLPSSAKLLLSLFPRAILRPSSSDPYGPRQNAPKANAIGNGTWLTRLTSTTCQGRSAGFQWYHLPARKVSMSRVTVLPLYCLCGFWILTHRNLALLALEAQQFPLNQKCRNGFEKWSLTISNPDVHTDLPGRAHRTDRHDQNMHNGRCQVCRE